MARAWRWLGVIGAILLFATAAGAAIPHFAFRLLSPHTAKRSTAALDQALARAVGASLSKASLESTEGAIDFALGASDKLLHFGLAHPTSLSFKAAEREGNCIEYAHLFARVFDMAAAKAKLDARAYVVHSARAELFGRAVPMRGWENHDWVLVQEGTGPDARRFFVDPTLNDAGLGWDISANVEGTVSVPP
jgi:hypothetical protein